MQLYTEERQYQSEVMKQDQEQIKRSLFANELLEIYNVIQLLLKDDPRSKIN